MDGIAAVLKISGSTGANWTVHSRPIRDKMADPFKLLQTPPFMVLILSKLPRPAAEERSGALRGELLPCCPLCVMSCSCLLVRRRRRGDIGVIGS